MLRAFAFRVAIPLAMLAVCGVGAQPASMTLVARLSAGLSSAWRASRAWRC